MLFTIGPICWAMGAWLSWAKSRLFCLALFLWSVPVAVICIRVARHPGSHSAFRSCRLAGANWLQQSRLYGPDTGFLYTPLIAALHAPFALLPEGLSEVFWRLIIGFSFPVALWFNGRAVFQFSKEQFASLLLLSLPLTLNTLNNGQANLVLVILFLVAVGAASESRWLLCAVCAAFAIYWKVYPIALALLLAVIFPGKLAARTLVSAVVLFGLSLFLQRPSYVLQEYGNWLVNLLSDRRHELEYYGKNRDFYLLLRLLGVPVSDAWWLFLQLLAAVAAAAFCLRETLRRAPVTKLLFGAMCLAVVWMLLFGPATEAATYVLVAVPSAYLLIAGWSHDARPAARITSTVAYLGFIGAEVVNSWFQIKRNVYLVHAIQPCVALCFCVALYYWWKQNLVLADGLETQRAHARVTSGRGQLR